MASPLLLTFLFYCCFLQICFIIRGQSTTTKSTTTTGLFLESCKIQTASESSMNLSWSKANSTLPVTYYYQIVNQSQTFSSGSLSASIQGLTPGTKYYFNVWANSGSSNSEVVTCGESTSPVKPLLLNVSQVDSTSLVATWSPGSTANGNFTAVYVCGNNPEQVKGLILSDNPVLLDNVAPGCNCRVTIRVISFDKMNASESSSIVTNPVINSSSCMISGVTNNSLILSWTSASACLPFTYYYAHNTSSFTTAPYSTTSNQAFVTGLSSGTVYTFRVYAKLNDTNNQSNNINCTSSTEPDTPVLSISNVNESSVGVSYSTGSTTTVDSKTLVYSCNSASNSQQVGPTSTNYVLSGLQPGCNYTIYLAVQRNDKAKTSNYVTIITNPALHGTNCVLSQITKSSMQLTWSPAQTSVPVVYTVQYDSKQFTNVAASLYIINLTPGTMYGFQVWATTTDGSSTRSRSIQCSNSTEPGIPSIIAVSNITTSSMEIHWLTSGTNVINFTTVNYTCGNNQQVQTAIANFIVLSHLKPACNTSFCIMIFSYDKATSACSWAVTHAVVPTFYGIDDTTTSSFRVTWEFGLTNLFGSTTLSYCDVTRHLDCTKLAVDNSTSVTLINLSSATNYTLTLEVYTFGNVTTSSPAWAVTKPTLSGVCTVDFRDTTSMLLSWPEPNESVALTYRVRYPNITLNSRSSAPDTWFYVSARPYVGLVQNLLAGATYRFWVLASISGETSSIKGSPQLKSDEVTCIDTTDPYEPKILAYTTTYNSITVTLHRPSNTVNVSQYIANITSSQGVSPEYHSSQEVESTGTDQEVKFTNLAASSTYTIKVTSVVYGECSHSGICGYESQKPAEQVITTNTAFPISMEPLFGPVAGGTNITITGSSTIENTPNNIGSYAFDISNVYIGSHLSATSLFKVNASSTFELVAVTPNTTEASIGQRLPVILGFSSNMAPFNMTFNRTFTYLPNPEITSLYPNRFIVNGGNLLDVFGQSLSSVAKPIIQLTVVITREAENSSSSTTSSISTSRVCTVPKDNDTYMQCPMPPLSLPDDFLEVLNLRYNTNVTRRRRSRDPINHLIASSHSLISRTKRDVNVLTVTGPNGGDRADIYLGFILDGYKKYENINDALPDTKLIFYSAPEINSTDERLEFDPSVDDLIYVKGRYMLRGCRLIDYLVHIGSQVCNNSDLQDNQLSCRPPKVEPSLTMNDTIYCDQHLSITITVGYKIYQYACLTYTDRPRRLALIVGLTVGLAVFALLLAILIAVCIVKCRRKKVSQETGNHQPSREAELRNRDVKNGEEPESHQDLNIIHRRQKTMTLYKPYDDYEDALPPETQEDYENVRRTSRI